MATDAIESLRPAIHASADELGFALSEPQTDALIAYLELLERWNATYNLTAVRDPAQMATQHLADCLAVVDPLRRQAGDSAFRLLDVGSGGGLPGVILAILHPWIDVTCVDAVGKKAAFIQQVAAELRLRNLHALHARVEAMQDAPFSVVTSRAFASLADFAALTRRHLAAGGVWMAMKGKLPSSEIAAVPANIDVFHVEPLRVPGLDGERHLVWMRPR
jgi:16S rRNA (guanine527-N7)-methyltransferase